MNVHSKKEQKKELFTRLYNKEIDAIFRFALLRVSDREKAMDIAQDTFVRFWDSLSQNEENVIEHERAFLFKIARNLIIDWYRKKKAVSLEFMLEEGTADFGALLLDNKNVNTEISSDARFALEKISELDQLYRQVVYMRFVEDLRPKDIAEILDESVNVVSVRITRGLEQLRKITGFDKKGDE